MNNTIHENFLTMGIIPHPSRDESGYQLPDEHLVVSIIQVQASLLGGEPLRCSELFLSNREELIGQSICFISKIQGL